MSVQLSSYNPDIDSRGRQSQTESTASIPLVSTKVFDGNGWLKYVNITNPATNSAAITINILDGNNVYFTSFLLPIGSNLSFVGAHWVSNGLYWSASAANLSGQMRMQS